MEDSPFDAPLHCAHCGAEGKAVWEAADRAAGPARNLLSLQGPFHPEIGRGPLGSALIVCSQCDEIQPD